MSAKNAGCLGFLFGLLGARDDSGPDAADRLPYQVRQDFLSRAEASFYHVLRQAAGDRFAIFAKVRLADIFFVNQQKGRQSWTNQITGKHVDFLLCDPLTLQPVAGLELDDASHDRPDRKAQDAHQIFEAAGLPLIHVPARRTYTLEDIRESLQLVAKMAASQVAVTAAAPARRGGAPDCPRCRVPLVARSAGKRSGGQFWGCPNYPNCRHTSPMD